MHVITDEANAKDFHNLEPNHKGMNNKNVKLSMTDYLFKSSWLILTHYIEYACKSIGIKILKLKSKTK